MVAISSRFDARLQRVRDGFAHPLSLLSTRTLDIAERNQLGLWQMLSFPTRTLSRSPIRSVMSEATLSSPLSLKNGTLWFGEIELHEEKIVISGWTWDGPFEKDIPIRKITAFETWANRKGPNFRLRIDGEASIQGRIEKGLGLWQNTLETDGRVQFKRRH